MESKIRIVLAEDHIIVRDGIMKENNNDHQQRNIR